MSDGETVTLATLRAKTAAWFAQLGLPTPRLDAELLIARAVGIERMVFYTDGQRPLSEAQVDACRALVRRRGRREPIAYILGQREFWSREFKVDPRVLIPRPDSETLIALSLAWLDAAHDAGDAVAPRTVVAHEAGDEPADHGVVNDPGADGDAEGSMEARRSGIEALVVYDAGEQVEVGGYDAPPATAPVPSASLPSERATPATASLPSGRASPATASLPSERATPATASLPSARATPATASLPSQHPPPVAAQRAAPASASGHDGVVLDYGTGSGALAITLLSERPTLRGLALDVSREALDVARENATRHGVSDRLGFVLSDALTRVPPRFRGALRAIVANPPYVPLHDRESLAPDVRDHEPAQALFAGPDALLHYRLLAQTAADWLAPDGFLALEVGAGQAEAVRALLTDAGWRSLETRRDLAGIERAIAARRPA